MTRPDEPLTATLERTLNWSTGVFAVSRMMDAMRGNSGFSDVVTEWVEADKARGKAAAALERADRKVQQIETRLRAMYEKATGEQPGPNSPDDPAPVEEEEP